MTPNRGAFQAEARWDLTPIYSGADDPAIAGDEAEVDRLVDEIQAHRERLVPGVAPEEVAEVLEEYERIRFLATRLGTFAGLAAAADVENAKLTGLHARIEERDRMWAARTVFVEIALRQLPAATLAAIIESQACERYRHFVRYQASLAPHTLSEAEEQIIMKKNVAGRDSLVRFREEFAGKLDFGTMTVDGREERMTMAALAALQEHRDPGVRLAARRRLFETYQSNLPIFTFLYQSVVKDYGIETELRSYSEPIEMENLTNEVPGVVFKALLASVRKYLPVMREYYAWKREKLGLEHMRTSDLGAPLPQASELKVPWGSARGIVEESFALLDPTMAFEIGRFFDEGRLDAGARKGKRQGAFCAPVPGNAPYVFMSYMENLNSLVTLAHELGHGIHFMLSGASQTFLQAYGMSRVIAETASELGEYLLRDHLLATTEDPGLRLKILSAEVERFIGVVFRQVLFTEFELRTHEHSAREPLGGEKLCDLWEGLSREYYGPDVELLECDRVAWSAIGHFLFAPFYCYSYALSQVVVLTLYRKWKEEGGTFLSRYLDLLRGGWSETPSDLLARAGIDLQSPAVIEGAFEEFATRTREVKEAVDR